MRMDRVALAAFALVSCTMEAPRIEARPRDERFPEVMVDVGVSQTVSVTRHTLQGEVAPVADQVIVLLLDAGNVQLQPLSVDVMLGNPSRAVVTFIAPTTMPLHLLVHWGDDVGSTEMNLRVVDILDTADDFEVTYADRVDVCARMVYRLPSGRLVCSRGDAGVTVYDADGGLEEVFAGVDVVARGAELWSDNSVGVEHRTDLPTGLRYDGVVPYTRGRPLGDTRPGAALRSTGDGFLEVTWDGGTLSSAMLEGITFVPPASDRALRSLVDVTAFRVNEELAVVGFGFVPTNMGNVCLLRRGCMTVTCPPVSRCFSGAAVALSEGAVWQTVTTFSPPSLSMVVRRRSNIEQARQVDLPEGIPDLPSAPYFNLDLGMAFSRPVVGLQNSSLLPVEDEQRVWLEVWNHGGVLVGADENWLISVKSPFTLRFHRVSR